MVFRVLDPFYRHWDRTEGNLAAYRASVKAWEEKDRVCRIRCGPIKYHTCEKCPFGRER